jgi:hypothetical protein
MAEEVKLSPGWLLREVRRAVERLDPSQHKHGASREYDERKSRTERNENQGPEQSDDCTKPSVSC